MSEKKNIYESIAAILNEKAAVKKDSRNEAQRYMFRGIDAVMNVFNPLLAKHRVFVVPTVLDMAREERQNKNGTALIYTVLTVQYAFYAEDGSFITAVVMGEGMDSGDKSVNKAMSAAYKYAMFQVFCVPTEEMVDSEVDSHEVMPKEPEPDKYRSGKPYDTVICESCGKEIQPTRNSKGVIQSVQDQVDFAQKAFGKNLCLACAQDAWTGKKKESEGTE